jgi:hypothetical protein
MRRNQIYSNGIITNHKPFTIWHKVEPSKEAIERSKIITFTIELITLTSLLAVVTLLAIALQ